MDAFIGTILPVAFDYAPAGWLPCDGRSLKVANYTTLYSLLGNTYGSDNVTFKLPDLRGRVILGMGQAPGLAQYARGATVGTESVTIAPAQLPPHTHALMGSTDAATLTAPTGASVVAATGSSSDAVTARGTPIFGADTGKLAPMSAKAIGNTGRGFPVDLRQPSLALNYIICVEGDFPARPT